MKVSRFNEYVISAWAEVTDQGWAGLATVHPAIANTWTGGPKGGSLVSDGVHMTEAIAEDAVTVEAVDAISKHVKATSGRQKGEE